MGDLADFFDRTVTIETWTGARDSYGKPTYNAPVIYPARVPAVWKAMAVRTVDGVAIYGRGPIYLNTVAAISPNDRITLPAGFTPPQPPILSASIIGDETGSIATQVVVG